MTVSCRSFSWWEMVGPVLILGCLATAPSVAQQPGGGPPGGESAPQQAASYGEPRPDVAVPQETLEEAWQIALENDQRIEASRWSISSAESTQAAAQAERLPYLTFGSSYYALSDQPTFSVSLPPLPAWQLPFVNRDSFGFQAMVSQPLYTFGRISSGINAAQEAVKAKQAECKRTKLDVKMNVAEIYVLALRATRLIEVAESKVRSLEAHTKDVAAFCEKGLVSRNDLLAAQVALADARQQAMQTHNTLQVAYAAYNRALGRRLDVAVNLAELGTAGAAGDVDEWTAMALQLRPELAGLSAQALRPARAGGRRAGQEAPQIGLQGGYIYQHDQYVDPNGVGMLALGLEWTPVDSGRISNQAAALSEKAEALIRLRKDAESMIAFEVRQKWLDLQTAQQRVAVTRQATAQADDNVRIARDRYQQQVGTNTEVLDAETLRVQAYTNFYNSSYESVLAELRLRRAIGNL